MIEGGLASSFASSLIILGCIPSQLMILKVPPKPGLSMILWSTSAFQLFLSYSPWAVPMGFFQAGLWSYVWTSTGGLYTNNDFFL